MTPRSHPDAAAPPGIDQDGVWLETAAHRLYRLSPTERDRIERSTLAAYRSRALMPGPGTAEVPRSGRAGSRVPRRRLAAGSALAAVFVIAIMALGQAQNLTTITYRAAVDRSIVRSAAPPAVERRRIDEDRDPTRQHATAPTPRPSEVGRPVLAPWVVSPTQSPDARHLPVMRAVGTSRRR